MTPTEINGIILTDDCISSIKTIQEGEHSWMEATLEKAIDLALDIDSPDIDSVNRLTLISEIRIIKKHIQSIFNTLKNNIMNRHEALQLVNKLLDPETPMNEKQRAAAQLSELIRILLPESDEEQK